MAKQKISSEEDEIPPRKRRKFARRLLIMVGVLVAGLVWLNGPGLRWLAPMVVSHYMEKLGAKVKFSLEGSLLGGIAVKDFHLTGYKSVASLTLDRAKPVYEIRELLKGRIQGLTIDGLHAELHLGEQEEESTRPPPDLQNIAESLRAIREQLVPLAIELTDVTLDASRNGKRVVALAPSRIIHAAGDDRFQIHLGALTDGNGREWPAQQSDLVWGSEQLTIQQIDPLPELSLRDLVLRLPAGGEPSAEVTIHLDEAVLVAVASPGLAALTVDLREGCLESAALAKRFDLELPGKASLTSLSLNVENLWPDPLAATGALRLLLENVESGELVMPEVSLDIEVAADQLSVVESGRLFGTEFAVSAAAPLTRDGGTFGVGDIDGSFQVLEVAKLVAGLVPHSEVIDPAAPVPPATAEGTFHVAMKELRPVGADVAVVVKPVDTLVAPPLAASGHWQPDQPWSFGFNTQGLTAKATYHPDSRIYDGSLVVDSFTSERVERWLAIVKADQWGAFSLNGSWRGGGDLPKGTHHGKLTQVQATWQREEMPPVAVDGGLDYSWPGAFATENLRLQTRDQVVTTDARLADGILELANLRYLDRGTELAAGSASLPVPADFAKWRDVLARDTRPVAISLESKIGSLAVLKDWLPAAAKLDEKSSGLLHLQVSGTYADPAVDARIQLQNLRSPEQAKLPPAELIVTLAGRDGRLTLEGSATAPDYPAALLSASMPFRPAAWAEDPALLATEKISGRVDLPRIDLSRFASLVASARRLKGWVTGHVELSGEVAKPLVMGQLELKDGGFEPVTERVAAVTGIAATVDLAIDRITLKSLKATMAGGTIAGSGWLELVAGKPGPLELRATANHLPVLRNESLIIRASAELRLAGSWDDATLSGNIGVVDSLFYRDIEILPIGTTFSGPAAAALPKIDAPPKSAPSMPEPFRNWKLQVLARTINPFLVRGNLATGRIEGSVKLGGTLGQPAPDGLLKISDVRASLPFSTLEVRHGTARFTPATGFDPELELRGTARPRPYQVNVFVYGHASDPQMVLTSNPPLPDTEIMTLLATGTTSSGLDDPQAASNRALQLLVEELRRGRFGVGKQLRPLLRALDRVEFNLAEDDPYSDDFFSSATLSITDRWLLSAGLGGESDSRVMLIWRLNFH